MRPRPLNLLLSKDSLLGIWCLLLLIIMLLVAIGFLSSSAIRMEVLLARKHDWLLKAIIKCLVSILTRHLVRLLSGHYASWM